MPDPRSLILKVSFSLLLFASPRIAVNAAESAVLVALAVDTSGSLREADLDRTRLLAAKLLRELPAGSELAIFAFDDSPRKVLDRTAALRTVEDAILSLERGGRFTTLYDAFSQTADYLKNEDASRKALVILTDGKDENSTVGPDEGLRLAREDRIPVFTIGVGRLESEGLESLRRISRLTKGEYLGIQESGSYLLSVAIQEAIASLQPPPSETPPVTEPEPPPPPTDGGPSKKISSLWSEFVASPVRLAAMIGLLFVAAVSAALALYWNRRDPNRCPTCGTQLPAPGVLCPRCSPPRPVGTVEPPRVRPPTDNLPLSPPKPPAAGAPPEGFAEKTRRLKVTGATLTIRGGHGTGQTFHLNLDGPNVIGRADNATIHLADDAISSQHCQIDLLRSVFTLKDLGSTNGTYVDGESVTETILGNGSELKVGETVLLFQIQEL